MYLGLRVEELYDCGGVFGCVGVYDVCGMGFEGGCACGVWTVVRRVVEIRGGRLKV